jgi:ribonuclease D
MNPLYITQQDELKAFCKSLSSNKPKIVSVDTEFIRKTTYWPKLCLIQLAFQDQIALIDPLPQDLDLSPLKEIFFDDEILKIFHAARQDLEVFYMLWGEVPQNIFDTQILAMVCGFGDSISYDKLSEALTSQKIDKSQQHTDWAQRPLSPKQISYAMGDVKWLEILYDKLVRRAGEKIEYIKEELNFLKNAGLYQPAPEKAWLKIKTYPSHKPEILGILKEIAAVREQYAQKKNKPRSHIIKDEILLQIASKPALSKDDLISLGISDVVFQEALLAAIRTAEPLKKQGEFRPKQNSILLDILTILLKVRSEQHGVAPKLIATRDRLESFLENPDASPLMQGWRFTLFGENALKITEGKMALSFNPKTHQPTFLILS